ncbi:putative vacuolar sorting protein SNF7 family protein [Aspergillus fischeri NRRL 181]|uniref:SNF7 family protein n=1 Tax=Neosartorya fischeri (strain ATCC 1020 / DSM 3700 / CBS 544.65 / FGSC A1164 / JCM 1740 / NRRL 181 / WB 181) TaxID=331117 RepID=A1DIN2_NEOFI|nr:SNF7 family protein [Aspergillus fischeri NRRL 181]EAW19239.1 SNF7 family protein [Aspergillus fischeri NRRL 181]
MSDLLNYILTQEDSFKKNRLPSLYSDFTLQKKTNPDGYAVNVAAWERALTRAARRGCISTSPSREPSSATGTAIQSDHLILRTDDSLLRALEIPEYGRPVALGAVLDEAIRKHTMVPLQVFKASALSLQQRQWRIIKPGALSPWNVMTWGMKQLRGFVVGSDTPETSARLQVRELVLVDNLKEAADRVVKQTLGGSQSKMDLIYSKERFTEEFATVLNKDSGLSSADFDVLLLYLSRDIGAIAYDGKTIRFRPSNDSPREITDQDATIASIKSLLSTMTKQVDRLESKIEELNLTAKVAVQKKNRVSALAAVRSKKLAEHNLKQRLDTLTQLEEVYSKIENAADQVEYVRVMEASTGVLRGLHTQIGGVERVEDVVEELREEMSKVDEIGNIMNEVAPEIDETELDDELEELENRERQAVEEKEAEETRKKLAELDDLEQKAKEAAHTAASEQSVDSAIEESIERLSHMSVEEGSGATAQ